MNNGYVCLVLVNALKSRIHSVDIKMHNGTTFSQKFVFEYFPMFCTACKRVGHTADRCRVIITSSPRTANPPRDGPSVDPDAGWQVQKSRRNRSRNARPRQNNNYSRSKSRGPIAKSIARPAATPTAPNAGYKQSLQGAIPHDPCNTHTIFDSTCPVHSTCPVQDPTLRTEGFDSILF